VLKKRKPSHKTVFSFWRIIYLICLGQHDDDLYIWQESYCFLSL